MTTPLTDIPALLERQRTFFRTGATRDVAFRIEALRRLGRTLAQHEGEICDALAADLGKPELEAVVAETAMLAREIDFTCRHLRRWAAPRRVRTSLLNFPASGAVHPEPFGVALVIAPWNYPVQLQLAPLVGALAAGNCAILKPSELTPRTSALLARLVAATFPAEHVTVVEGGAEAAQALLEQRFDTIFFTGSTRVGRLVMQAAARHLTPVVLELGGKSPAIVAADADLESAARRIAWGKFFNAGQTCVAPDYLLVHASAREELVARLVAQIEAFYGSDPRQSPDYARIVSAAHLERLAGFLGDGRLVTGGIVDRAARYLAPTILEGVDRQAPVMQEEIFGPILPVLEFSDGEDPLELVGRGEPPLALYYFSRDRAAQKRAMAAVPFGGGCVNDTVVHLTEAHLPFGGVGGSGMGRYHGRAGFEAFSTQKSVLRRGTWPDLPLRYPPYAGKLGWLRALMKRL